MTEQEKREQKIAKTIEDLEGLTIDCTCLGITNDECDKCFRRKIAKYVLEREEEVAKKLLDGIEKSFDTGREHWMYQFVKDALKEFCDIEVGK